MNERLIEFIDRRPYLSDFVQGVVLIGVVVLLAFTILKDKIKLWAQR